MLLPVRISVPLPVLVRPVKPPSPMTELMVRLPLVLNWWTTKSPLEGPNKVPPVMVEALLPTAEVTRIPPELIVLPIDAVERVTVFAAAVLNLTLFVVESAAGELLEITSVLFRPPKCC